MYTGCGATRDHARRQLDSLHLAHNSRVRACCAAQQTEWKKNARGTECSKTVSLAILQTSLRVMDKDEPVENIMLHRIVSWEVAPDKYILSLVVRGDDKKGKARHIDLATDKAEEVSGKILEVARLLAKQKKEAKKARPPPCPGSQPKPHFALG